MSESSSSSSFNSMPVTPPADLVTQGILDQVSNVAMNYANQIYSWGQNVFNNLQSFTDANVAQLTQAADTAMNGANTSMNQFTGSFLPDYQNLRTTAAQYANQGRQARNAGMAESDQMQAGDAARQNAEQNLQSMGIDPSSGRYADLENAQRTATAAAAAGAGTQSIRADESTALGLQKQALDYGIQLPGIAANFLNQANQARSISQNAETATANTGANLMQLPNAYLSTAMNNKYPPSGQASSSSQNSNSSGPPPQSRPSGGAGGGGSSSGAAYNPNWDSGMYTNTGQYQSDAYGTYQPNAAIMQIPDGSTTPDPPPVVPPPGLQNYNNMSSTDFTDYSANNSIYNGGQSDPFASDYGGYSTGGNDYNPGATNTGDVFSSTPAYNSYDNSQGFTDNSGSASTDNSGYSSGGFDDSGDSSSGFARGGAIPDPTATPGGQVPVSASPSAGQQVDDVHASLTPDEFVIPRDVAMWKGQEFFQKLIAQSRKNRATAPAHGKPAAPPTGPVRFASNPTG